jgi:hypothetical protein
MLRIINHPVRYWTFRGGRLTVRALAKLWARIAYGDDSRAVSTTGTEKP